MGWNASQRCITIVQPLQNETKPVTVERSAELSDEYFAVDAESQNRQLQSAALLGKHINADYYATFSNA